MYKQVSSARTVAEVVRLTREYVASWTREELEGLPDRCRPKWIRTFDDIEFWADRLAAESEKAVLIIDDERRLDRLTSHFLIASLKIRQLIENERAAAAAA